MARAATWVLAAVISIALNAAVLGGLALSLRPSPIPQQPPPPAEIDLVTQQVRRSQATEAEAAVRTAPGRDAAATALSQDAPRQTRASVAAPASNRLAAEPPPASTPTITDATSPQLHAAVADVTATQALDASGQKAAASTAVPSAASKSIETAPIALRDKPVALKSATAQPTQASVSNAMPAAGTPTKATQADSPILASSSPAPRAPTEITARPVASPVVFRAGTALPQAEAPATVARPGRAAAHARAAAETPAADAAPHLTAALAWAVGEASVADPVSLAAIQAFMRPQDATGDASQVRDGLEALLAGIPCARLQTEFVPETNTLELRGHVPEEAFRAPLLAALQQQIGSNIKVADEMLILPAPQCGALTGIASVGLPQSDDQRTNPRIVGANAHVREFRYREGDRLALDLVAPDYDAYVYIDYFDANGNVLHLQPNEIVPLERARAKAPLTAGFEGEGRPGLDITIGPPFGQEIAAAFATSVRLYDGVRPLMEPAQPYLDFLRERVAGARQRDPAFKGEWVYFFVTTRPAG